LMKPWSHRTSALVTGVMGVLLVASVVTVFSPIPREGKGAAALILLLVLIFLRVPVGAALGLGGLAGILSIGGLNAVASAAGNIAFAQIAVWSLSVIPMFIFMGLLLWRSGLTSLLYDAAKVWLGWMPGGLAVTTNVAGAGLGSVSGSTIGITFALARLAIPEMLRAGYDRRLATGSVLVSGLAGQLIPPSVLLVVYAGIAGTPVGQQLISGVVPGLLLAGTFVITIILVSGVRPSWAPRPPRQHVPMSTRIVVTAKALPVLLIAVMIVGAIQSGLATPTESAAFGVLGAAILTVVYNRRDSLRVIGETLLETAVSCAALFFLIAGAGFVTRMLSTSGLSKQLQVFIDGLGIGNTLLLLLIMLLFLLMGMFLDTTPILLLVVPILIPILVTRDIDLIWFGVFTVILCELGIVSPPVGMLSFIVHKITRQPEVNLGQRISLSDVFVGGSLFLPIVLVLVVVLILFPEIVAWLPSLAAAP
ncbi:MAG: TRAP transporter large permease, partial [Planctomycetaceae bacterium]